MICGSNFSWIKVQSTFETVHEAFNFNLPVWFSTWGQVSQSGREPFLEGPQLDTFMYTTVLHLFYSSLDGVVRL